MLLAVITTICNPPIFWFALNIFDKSMSMLMKIILSHFPLNQALASIFVHSRTVGEHGRGIGYLNINSRTLEIPCDQSMLVPFVQSLQKKISNFLTPWPIIILLEFNTSHSASCGYLSHDLWPFLLLYLSSVMIECVKQ